MIDPLLDQIVDGWHVLIKVGQGATGTVYEARRGEARAALKVIHPDTLSPESVGRFEREVLLLAELEHPHIVRCLGAGEGDGFLYVVLEFLEGGSLDRQLRQRGRLSVPEAVGIGQAMAAALIAAHEAGIVHRDIKPANLLLDLDGAVKLADFNLARRESADHGITKTGTIVGTPYYMSPEQVEAADLGPPTDLYAVGAVLYHLVAGHPPYEGSSSLAVLQKHLKSEVPCLAEEVADAPRELSDLITELLSKDPGSRPDAAATLARLASLETARLELVEVPQPIYTQRPPEDDQGSASREGLDTAAWRTFNLEPTKQVGSSTSKRWQSGPGTSSVDLLGSGDDEEPATDTLGRMESVPPDALPCAPARPLPRGRALPTVDALTLLLLAGLGLALYDRFQRARQSDIMTAVVGDSPLVDSLRAGVDVLPPWAWALFAVVLLVDRILARSRRYGIWWRAWLGFRYLRLRVVGRVEPAAVILEQLGSREAAGRLLRRAGLFREASGYYEAAGRFEEQAELLLEGGSREGALAAFRAAATPRAQFNAGLLGDTSRLAAEALAGRGEIDRAAQAHLRGGRPLDAADLLEGTGRIGGAAQALETAYSGQVGEGERRAQTTQAMDFALRIAGLYLELDEVSRGAEWYAVAGDFETAGDLYLRLGDSLGRASCLSEAVPRRGQLNDRERAQLREAARIYVEAVDPAGIPLLVRLADFGSAAELSRNLGEDAQAAQHFARADRPHEGALCAERAGNRSLAAYLFRESGQHVRAVELYRELGELEEAAATARQAGDPGLQAELLETLGDYFGAAQSLLVMSMDDEAGEVLAQVAVDHADYPDAMVLAGELHHAASRHRLASRAYGAGLPEGPVPSLSFAGPTLRYAESLEQVGELDEALQVLARFSGTPLGPPDLRQREARLGGLLKASDLQGTPGGLPRRPASGSQRIAPPPKRPRSSRALRRLVNSDSGSPTPGSRSRPGSGKGRRAPRGRPPSSAGHERPPRRRSPSSGSHALPSPRRRSPSSGSHDLPVTARRPPSAGHGRIRGRPPVPPPSGGRRRGVRPGSGRVGPPLPPGSGQLTRPSRLGPDSSSVEGRPGGFEERTTSARALVGRTLGSGTEAVQLERWAGQTTTAWVYAARQGRREVTVKVLRSDLETPERRRAWAALAAEAEVPGTPASLAGAAVEDQPAYLVYEQLLGEGLDRALARGSLSDGERESLVYDLLTIMAGAHRLGLAHLDLRPSKVRRGTEGVFLVDLGHLRALGETFPSRDLLDPRYASPEQAEGALGDRASDVYQLGILAHKVLFGRLPFSAVRAEDFWELHLEAEPDLSAAEGLTRTVLGKALARDPRDRYPDAGALLSALFGVD